MNAAQKIVNTMKRVNENNKPISSKIVSLTTISINPIIFELENRLQITNSFYTLSSQDDWSKLQVGDKVQAFSFNNGQQYFILERFYNGENPNPYSETGSTSIRGAISNLEESTKNMITIPIGSGVDYFGINEPVNFLFADGRELNKYEYPELFNIIGYLYGGSGDIFNLPDKREAVTIMQSENFKIGKTTGNNNLTITKANLPNYDLKVTDPGHTHTKNGYTFSSGHGTKPSLCDSGATEYTMTTNSSTTGIIVNLDGENKPLNIMQKSLICNYIIRVR